MLEKTGEVKVGVTICDKCSEPATVIVGKTALCVAHSDEAKQASVHDNVRINAITDPVDDVVSTL